MDFDMSFGSLIFEPKGGFCKFCRLCMMTDFENDPISRIFRAFARIFLPEELNFNFFTQSKGFCKGYSFCMLGDF